MPPDPLIRALEAWPLDAAMREAFTIATGTKTSVNNVLVAVRLSNGVVGYGEGAPSVSGRLSQSGLLDACRRQSADLVGRDIRSWRRRLEELEERLPGQGPARAAVGMALCDAWAKNAGLPLRLLFGGAQRRLHTDVTVTLGTPGQARAAAERIVGMGIRTIKVKVGKDIEEDTARIEGIAGVAPGLRLLLDANQGYSPRQSLTLLKRLKALNIAVALFEQPAAKDDWRGLKDVARLGGVAVAADESVENRRQALELSRRRAVQVINVKLMKSGLLEAWDIALICRAAGLGLMIGGMVESTLAMTCAAHLAAGLGGFAFVDLDTPLWFKEDPMRGLRLGPGGLYDLAKVRSGIGVHPQNTPQIRVA